MNIVIMGAGAVGSHVGALLTKNGQNVTLIAREKHASAITTHGLILSGEYEETVKLSAVSSPSNITGSVDVLLITTKSYDTASALESCKDIINDHTLVVSLQNGLGNEDTLATTVDKKNIIGGITTIGSAYLNAGHIQCNGNGQTRLGYYFSTEQDDRLQKLVDLFNASSLPTTLSTTIKQDIYEKFLINVGLNALGTIAHVRNGKISQNPHLKDLFAQLIKEGLVVLDKEGIKLSESVIEKGYEACKNTANNLNSLYQDMLKKKKTEIDYFNGKVIELGSKHHIPTPYNHLVYHLIKAKEAPTS